MKTLIKKNLMLGVMLTSLLSTTYAEMKLTPAQQAKVDYTVTWKNNCEWRLEGCVYKDPDKIDLRTPTRVMLDNMFACKNTPEGCTEEELKAIATIQRPAISHLSRQKEDISAIINAYEKEHKQAIDSKWIPINLDNKELISFLTKTSLGLLLFNSDDEIMDFVQDNKSDTTEEIAHIGNLFGREAILPTVVGSYFVGAVTKNGKLKKFALFTVATGLATQLVTEGFKKSFDRERPNTAIDQWQFGKDGNNSFFSGHASGAWSFATMIAETFKEDNKFIPYVAYAMAAVTTYARMHEKKHWSSDVFFGAIAGHYITKMMLRNLKDEKVGTGGFLMTPQYDELHDAYLFNFVWMGKGPKEKPLRCTQLPEGSKERYAMCAKEIWNRSNR